MDTGGNAVAAFFMQFLWVLYCKSVNHYQNWPLIFGLGLETVSGQYSFAVVGAVPVQRFQQDKSTEVNLFPPRSGSQVYSKDK